MRFEIGKAREIGFGLLVKKVHIPYSISVLHRLGSTMTFIRFLLNSEINAGNYGAPLEKDIPFLLSVLSHRVGAHGGEILVREKSEDIHPNGQFVHGVDDRRSFRTSEKCKVK